MTMDEVLADPIARETVDWDGFAIGQIDLTRLRPEAGSARAAAASLDADEVLRAATFRAGEPRDMFIRRRLALRRLLGARLGCAPGEVTFGRDAAGKPFIVGAPFGFSVSYSGDWLMLLTSPGRRVGCDIAALRDVSEPATLARAVLPERAAAWVASLPEDNQASGFVRCWTLREAFGKAIGGGLLADLTDLDTTTTTTAIDARPVLLTFQHTTWYARSWPCGSGRHVAAVVALFEDGPMLPRTRLRGRCYG
jgi:4'-phosphopantetheinyl transferase